MAAVLGRSVTTLCNAWRLTFADGSQLGFTDHDLPLEIGGLAFEPQTGMSASEVRQSLGLAVDSVDVSGALSSETIREADILSGRFDAAVVETLLVDWTNPDAHMVVRSATVGRISRSDGAFTAELDTFARGFDQPHGRYFRRGCDAEVGDVRCGVDLAATAYKGSGTVTSVSSLGIATVTGLDSFQASWFTGGIASFANAGRRRVIAQARDGLSDLLTLADGPRAVVAGELFDITVGCDKGFVTCREKFANGINFQGFPHLPGNDAAYAYAREDAVFDGSPLVP
jgi:uncharacterized phage protein (TIGR02218 family)